MNNAIEKIKEQPYFRYVLDIKNYKNGFYEVTFNNGFKQVMKVFDGDIFVSSLLANKTLEKIKGYRPVKLKQISI